MAPSFCSSDSICSLLTLAQCPCVHFSLAWQNLDGSVPTRFVQLRHFLVLFFLLRSPISPGPNWVPTKTPKWGSQFKQGENLTHFEMILFFFAPFFFFWGGRFFDFDLFFLTRDIKLLQYSAWAQLVFLAVYHFTGIVPFASMFRYGIANHVVPDYNFLWFQESFFQKILRYFHGPYRFGIKG